MNRTYVVNYNTYTKYINDNKTNKLSKNEKITINKGKPILEIFDTNITDFNFELSIEDSMIS